MNDSYIPEALMKRIVFAIAFSGLVVTTSAPITAQTLAVDDPVLKNIWTEAMENSQLEQLAHELMDGYGTRLTGSRQYQAAHQWAVDKFSAWGITAENEQYGTWIGWERGITHVDLLEPWVRTLDAMSHSWSPGTKRPIKAEALIVPIVANAEEFQAWLPEVDGKFVLVSFPEPTGRPDEVWQASATPASYEKMQEERNAARQAFNENYGRAGFEGRRPESAMVAALEEAGAAGILSMSWHGDWGTYRVFGGSTKEIPSVQLALEDYTMLYRMARGGMHPIIELEAESENLGPQPALNTVAMIPGTEKPDEYVVLMGHFDTTGAAYGACDNTTGSLMMMEALRILKKYYPNPKRTIVVGLWGSEEQGLNGSRAFVEDHPEIIAGLQAGFNQDNGTGRIVRMSDMGFIEAGPFLAKWISLVPTEVGAQIDLQMPGMPSGGGSDHASFVAAGVPCFSLGASSWEYGYTWHTQRDTYDKLVFDDWRNNVILAASLAYLASEEDDTVPRTKRAMPIDPRTGEPREWPQPRQANRAGGGR